MSRLRACYQNTVGDQTLWLASITTYWDVLSGYAPEDIRAAFAVAWRRHPEWMPSAGQLAKLMEGGATTTPEDAWPEVLRLASRSSGEHSDPIAREVIRMMGGGTRLGRMRSDELHVWGKKEFIELYGQVAQRVDTAKARDSIGPHALPQDVRGLVAGVLGRGGP